ncbi:hypothetical protein HAX54_010994, partial [Datura stramonium]|nr:hypothetical protein [Datura stramonium]
YMCGKKVRKGGFDFDPAKSFACSHPTVSSISDVTFFASALVVRFTGPHNMYVADFNEALP